MHLQNSCIMKKNILLCLLVAISPVLSFAQGCLTIFSEDGDRFYLVLNGIKQNAMPQTNVRVDGLTSQFYSAKILFEDGSKPEITKSIPVTDPGTSNFADVTYKIKRTKDGELKLRYFGATPVPVNYAPPADMYVVHYGQAAPPPPPVAASTVTQTTYTTTTTNPTGASVNVNGGGLNMNVNIGDGTNGGGLNMNVNLNDRGMNVGTSQSTVTTTTTTSSSSTVTDNGYNAAPPPPPTKAGCTYPMDMNSFGEAKKTIANASFEDTKLSTAKSILAANCVSTDQVIAICKMFSYEESKLDFAKFAYPKTTDRGNYFKVGNVFSFDASKTELNEFINQ